MKKRTYTTLDLNKGLQTVWGEKGDMLISGIQDPVINPHSYTHLILDKES